MILRNTNDSKGECVEIRQEGLGWREKLNRGEQVRG